MKTSPHSSVFLAQQASVVVIEGQFWDPKPCACGGLVESVQILISVQIDLVELVEKEKVEQLLPQ